jgi:hypothetical protein
MHEHGSFAICGEEDADRGVRDVVKLGLGHCGVRPKKHALIHRYTDDESGKLVAGKLQVIHSDLSPAGELAH